MRLQRVMCLFLALLWGAIGRAWGEGGALAVLEWGAVSSPKEAGTAFPVTIRAKGAGGQPLPGFESEAELRGYTGGIREVGTGALTWAFPLYTFYEDARTQVIYLQSEIGEATRLRGLALNVVTLPGQALTDWTIRMKHTVLSQYAEAEFKGRDSGWTIVHRTSTNLTSTGWVWFEFSEPFDYNGTDNLMVDFSFNNSFWTSHGQVAASHAPNRSLWGISDSFHGDPLDWPQWSYPPWISLDSHLPDIRLSTEVDVDISPTQTTAFAQGVWSGWVTVNEAAEGMVLSACHEGVRGDSMRFNVEWDVPLLPPAALWAAETNETWFVAEWTEVPGATSYRLDVSDHEAFAGGGGGGGLPSYVVDFEGPGEIKGAYASGTVALSGLNWDMTQAMIGADAADFRNGQRSARLRGYGTSAMTMLQDWPHGLGAITFEYRRYGSDAQVEWCVEMSSDAGGTWSQVGSSFTAPASDAVQTFSNQVQVAGPIRIRIRRVVQSGSQNRRLNVDDIVLTPYSEGGDGHRFLPGFSNLAVSATSQAVEGLADNTAYFFRVHAVSNDYSGPYSTTSRVTTVEAPRPPVFTSSGDVQSAYVGEELVFAVTASAWPLAELALVEASASGGYHFIPHTGALSYTPPAADEGLQAFTFIASNFMGVVTQQVPVAVSPQPPGGGLETFDDFPPGGQAYQSGTFMGQDGSTWTYAQARGDLSITGKSPTLRNTAGSFIRSGVLRGGIASLQLNYQQAFSTPVHCSIYINDIWIGTLTGGAGAVEVWSIEDLGIEGRFVMTFSNRASSGQVTLDDIEWTGYADGSPTGTRPTLPPLPPQTAVVGEAFEYTLVAEEPDGDPVTYICLTDVDPATWTLDAATGEFRFTPVEAQIGLAEFVFRAADKDGTSLPVRMEVTVESPLGIPLVYFGGPLRVYAEEGGPSVTLPVHLSFPADASVRVGVEGTAWAQGVDFSRSATTLVFSNEGPATLELELTIVDDDLAEGPESARIRLNPLHGAMADPARQDVILFIRDNDAFSVVAANLTSGHHQAYEAPGVRILQALCPDIVLIQEFNLPGIPIGSTNDYRAWVDEHFGPDFHFYVEPQWGGQAIPTGIISRWPILDAGEWEDVQVSNRDFSWATIDLPGPRKLHAVSVHWYAQDAAVREAQARALTNYVAQAGWSPADYLVVGGDLNLGSRAEAAMSVLGQIVSDAHQPADQNGNKNTNRGRTSPYDYVLPNAVLDSRHRASSMWGHDFPDGLVFDTRPGFVKWESGLPPPALETDSDALNMQHMAVMKVFELEQHLAPPSGFAADYSAPSGSDVTWTPNAAGDEVVVVWNTDGEFLAPSGEPPAPGEPFAGGVVLHAGPGTDVRHEHLASCGTYHYRAWSFAGHHYSSGVSAFVLTPGPSAPAAVWAAETHATGFTAAWSAVPGIEDYRLDVSPSPSFQDDAGVRQTIFRETMGSVTSTTAIAVHQANGGFDNPGLTMDGGGAEQPVAYVPGYSNRIVTGTSQVVTGLVEGLTYYYRVQPVDGECLGAFSSTGQVTTASAPSPAMSVAAWEVLADGPGYRATMAAVPDTPGWRIVVYGASAFDEELQRFAFEWLEEEVEFSVDGAEVILLPDESHRWRFYRIGFEPP